MAYIKRRALQWSSIPEFENARLMSELLMLALPPSCSVLGQHWATGTERVRQTFCNRDETMRLRERSMTRSARIAIAAALLLGGTSLAVAKIRGAGGAHGNPPRPDKTTERPTAADPYFRLSDPYYGYSDPYRSLFDFYAAPPYIPGYSYSHVRPRGW